MHYRASRDLWFFAVAVTALYFAGTDRYSNADEISTVHLADDHCKLTNWTEWSECTAICGTGKMTRTRRFLKPSGYKNCPFVSILQRQKCMKPSCETRDTINCSTTEWSDWSPCSVICGKGVQIRKRNFTAPADQWASCKTRINLEATKECIKTKECAKNKEKAIETCLRDSDIGPCRTRTYYQRWYFDKKTGQCTKFAYGGCKGNENNFRTRPQCMEACSFLHNS